MPDSIIHLSVARKVNPDVGIDFYVGNVAPDAIQKREIKDKVHFDEVSDMEDALRKFALKADNDYLKGMLLHLFTDRKWKTTHLVDFQKKEGEGWWAKYVVECDKVYSYAFHIQYAEWTHNLYEKMQNWDYSGFIETEFIKKDNVKSYFQNVKSYLQKIHKWSMENKIEASSVFTPILIEKFVNDTANDFNKWFSNLADLT